MPEPCAWCYSTGQVREVEQRWHARANPSMIGLMRSSVLAAESIAAAVAAAGCGGLLGEDAVCFDFEERDEQLIRYIEARLDEAHQNAAMG